MGVVVSTIAGMNWAIYCEIAGQKYFIHTEGGWPKGKFVLYVDMFSARTEADYKACAPEILPRDLQNQIQKYVDDGLTALGIEHEFI